MHPKKIAANMLTADPNVRDLVREFTLAHARLMRAIDAAAPELRGHPDRNVVLGFLQTQNAMWLREALLAEGLGSGE